MRKVASILFITVLSARSTTPQIAIDPKSISDVVKFNKDKDEYTAVAQTYDLSVKIGKNAMVGGAVGWGQLSDGFKPA